MMPRQQQRRQRRSARSRSSPLPPLPLQLLPFCCRLILTQTAMWMRAKWILRPPLCSSRCSQTHNHTQRRGSMHRACMVACVSVIVSFSCCLLWSAVCACRARRIAHQRSMQLARDPAAAAAAAAAASAAAASQRSSKPAAPASSGAPFPSSDSASASSASPVVVHLLVRGPLGSGFSKRFKVFRHMEFGVIMDKLTTMRGGCSSVELKCEGHSIGRHDTPERFPQLCKPDSGAAIDVEFRH